MILPKFGALLSPKGQLKNLLKYFAKLLLKPAGREVKISLHLFRTLIFLAVLTLVQKYHCGTFSRCSQILELLSTMALKGSLQQLLPASSHKEKNTGQRDTVSTGWNYLRCSFPPGSSGISVVNTACSARLPPGSWVQEQHPRCAATLCLIVQLLNHAQLYEDAV